MSDELTKVAPATDGFEDWRDDEQSRGVLAGTTIAKFTNEATWVTRDEEELPPDVERIATGIIRLVQKWIDGIPDPNETRVLAPEEKFPDIEALNEAAPKSEWSEGPDGRPRGPWQAQYVVQLLDPKTMERYSYPTGTVGGGIAVRELKDKVQWMRKLRGQNVYAVVTLANKFMKTRFGGRQRPHFIVTRWITLGADEQTALPAPAHEVKEPTLAEEMNDSIPDGEAPWNDELPDDLKPPKAEAPKAETPQPKNKEPKRRRA